MIHFTCPACRKTYKVADEFAGRTTKCRNCGQALRVPESSAAPPVAAAAKPVAARDQIGPEGFRVRAVRCSIKFPGTGSIEGPMPASCAYGDVAELFEQHGRELGCPPSPYVGMCLCNYRASVARKAVGCLAGFGTMILISSFVAVLLAGGVRAGGAGAAVGATGIFQIVAMVVGLVLGALVYFKITWRKAVVVQASGLTLPTVEKYTLLHRNGTLLTLAPLAVNKSEKPPFFTCDHVIEIDLRRVPAQAVPVSFLGLKSKMLEGCVTLVPNAPALLLSVLDQGMPPAVVPALLLESTAADATPPLGLAPVETKTFESDAFRFDYPAARAINEKNAALFVNAPDNGFVAFFTREAQEELTSVLERLVAPHEVKMVDCRKASLTRWAKFDGVGLRLRGRYEGTAYSTVRVFAFSAEGRTIAITEFLPDVETPVARVGRGPGRNRVAGRVSPPGPHTTVHAGPHTAVRRRI